MKNLPYFLALNRMNKVGPRTVLKLLKRWPDLQEMFQLSACQLEAEGLPKSLALTISSFDLNTITEDMDWIKSAQEHYLLTWESPEYPQLLKEISDPPMF